VVKSAAKGVRFGGFLANENADLLNPWGDYQPSATPPRSKKATATTEAWPWGGGEVASPRGDSEEASPGP
jgi:hypothetical protein